MVFKGDTMGNSHSRQFKDWLVNRQLFNFLFASIPKTSKSEPRWAIFQVILSFFFLFVATAIALLTVDFQTVRGETVIVALIPIFFAMAFFVYAVGVGIHWYKSDSAASGSTKVNDDNGNASSTVRDNRLHDDIQALIHEMREARNEPKSKPKKQPK